MAKKQMQNRDQSQKKSAKKVSKKPSMLSKGISSIKNYWDQKSPVLKFLIGFATCMVVFYLIYLSPFFVENIGKPILTGQAKISSFILNIFGQGTTANQDVISSPEYTISIKKGCDGLETLAIMLSGIVVFPISFKLKWPGLLYGTLALMVLNLFRIAGLYLVGKNFSQTVFDILHEQGGFVIFTVLGVFLWIIWANWALNKKDENFPSPTTATEP